MTIQRQLRFLQLAVLALAGLLAVSIATPWLDAPREEPANPDFTLDAMNSAMADAEANFEAVGIAVDDPLPQPLRRDFEQTDVHRRLDAAESLAREAAARANAAEQRADEAERRTRDLCLIHGFC